jgi:HSP20 family protein
MLPIFQSNGSVAPSTVEGPVGRISNLLDRLFDEDIFAARQVATTAIPLGIWEDADHFYVEVDAPGLTENDFSVETHNGVLLISGERKCQRDGKGYDTRAYGRFEQRISLPIWAKADQVEAKLANGVLSLNFPKAEEAKPRKIALNSK